MLVYFFLCYFEAVETEVTRDHEILHVSVPLH